MFNSVFFVNCGVQCFFHGIIFFIQNRCYSLAECDEKNGFHLYDSSYDIRGSSEDNLSHAGFMHVHGIGKGIVRSPYVWSRDV